MWISHRNPHFLSFFSGSCSETEVSEQLYWDFMMGNNLRRRLLLIKKTGGRRSTQAAEDAAGSVPETISALETGGGFTDGWVRAGHQTLKRVVVSALPGNFPRNFPSALAVLLSDFARFKTLTERLPLAGDLLFFDLETTGLSGGAGTLAFLAAFARLVPGNPGSLKTVQYLLLDYPGENDFLEALLGEFTEGGKKPVIVSYNGKSFDAQILKTRCLMNGISPPDFFHADLLHPSRRLWKKALGGCSQGEIERSVLGINRDGDTPGALAPDIWFHFLKTGETGALLGICDHNIMDVRGLAALFSALVRIAEDPLGADVYRADPEQLALIWRRAAEQGFADDETLRTGERLLAGAAALGCPRSLYLRSRDLFLRGKGGEGRTLLSHLARGPYSAKIRVFALRALAVDAEWRLGDAGKALLFTEEALALDGVPEGPEREMEKRRIRLLKKAGKGG
jgi:uncharacterized protein YprB with RNaseH-like and TPR domain